MNILIFVISLAMILSLMTYGRLDMYRSFIVVQGEFKRYMEVSERENINQDAKVWYDWVALQEKMGGEQNPSPRDASSKLSMYSLLHDGTAKAIDPYGPVYRDLLKKMIFIIYGDQKKFIEALNKTPNLIDELLNAIQASSNQLNLEEKPIKTIDGLKNLSLGRADLQEIFYWMTKGVLKPENNIDEQSLFVADKEEGGELSTEKKDDEHIEDSRRISILDYITIDPKAKKIRVFLASKELLTALFGDSSTVDNISNTRYELYKTAKQEKKPEEIKALSEQFKQQYSSRAINVPEAMLDFTVTKTNPRLYN